MIEDNANLDERYHEWMAALAAQQRAAEPAHYAINAALNGYRPLGWSQADPGPRYHSINPRKRMTDAEVKAFNRAALLRRA
jgi:hypothetical protein